MTAMETKKSTETFPMVAVTNYHKFSDLKQQKFIILQF